MLTCGCRALHPTDAASKWYDGIKAPGSDSTAVSDNAAAWATSIQVVGFGHWQWFDRPHASGDELVTKNFSF